MGETSAQTLERLISELRAEDAAARLNALNELRPLNYTSAAILRRLEQMVVNDPDTSVRQAALEVLANPAHRYVQQTISGLATANRKVVLWEIRAWQQEGLLLPEQAEMLRLRYDVAESPAKPAVAPAPVVVPAASTAHAQVAPAPTEPAPPPKPREPRPSLTQRLLSQSAINVFLYLGAFLVIGAALILAALVQAARLPILTGVVVVFAASAVALKKRLPQPSFTLFIVASFLLPILASVLYESLHISGRETYLYWAPVLFILALIWTFATWFYASRLFSLVAFASFELSFLLFPNAFTQYAFTELDWNVFWAGIALLVALGAVFLLKRWKGGKFALPLFIAAQLVELAMLLASLSSVLAHLFSPTTTASGDWFAVTLTWLAAAAFYAMSDLLFAFPLFRWGAIGALLPMGWLVPQMFHAGDSVHAASLWAWAAILAVASEPLARMASARARAYALATLFGAVPLFMVAVVWAEVVAPTAALWALAGVAVLLTALHAIRPRLLLWTVALVFGLAAYFQFFALPRFAALDIAFSYQWLGASVLLLLPELFMPYPGGPSQSWRAPLLVLGALTTFLTIVVVLSLDGEPRMQTVCFAAFAVLSLAYGLHFRRPALGYLATTSAATAVLCSLWPIQGDAWLPVFTGIALAYYIVGVLLRRAERTRAWADPAAVSGLALGALVAIATLIQLKQIAAIYVTIIAAMFFAETYLRKSMSLLEASGPLLLSVAALLALPRQRTVESPWLLVIVSFIWLLADAAYQRTLAPRKLAVITRVIAGVLVLVSTVQLLAFVPNSAQVAACLGLYALFFALDGWFYRQPLLGYAAAAFLPLSAFFALRGAGQHNWLYAVIGIAVVYYVIGYWLRRRGEAQGWSQMLLVSGLGLATLNSLSAPLQSGLQTSIPVAIAATLWAAEAFARRNVWLGFPANLLYLEAYCLILFSLKVNQPQFFSVGAAVLGMLMHYLLTRAGSKTGAFLTGMVSQLVLLGTTYIQMYSTQQLAFFAVLFFQALVILGYGIVIRSRSLLITPILFIVLSVFTVVYSALKGFSTVVLIGGTGILLLLLGILAVVLRERLVKLGDQWSGWGA